VNLDPRRKVEMLIQQLGTGTIELRLFTTLPTGKAGEYGTELSAPGYAAVTVVFTTPTEAATDIALTADASIGPNSDTVDWPEVAGWVLTRDEGGGAENVTWGELYGGLVVQPGQPVPFKLGSIKVKLV